MIPDKYNWCTSKSDTTHLELSPCPVDPAGILSHAVGVGESLDPHFDFAGIIKNATVPIHEVTNRRGIEVGCSVAKDGVVPTAEVGIVADKVR